MGKTNNKSIYALLSGICSIFPFTAFVGLIFGIIGLVMSCKSIKEIKKSKEKGIALAVSGMVISIVGICSHVLIIFVLTTFSPTPPFQ